jgi:hypothetical protein
MMNIPLRAGAEQQSVAIPSRFPEGLRGVTGMIGAALASSVSSFVTIQVESLC